MTQNTSIGLRSGERINDWEVMRRLAAAEAQIFPSPQPSPTLEIVIAEDVPSLDLRTLTGAPDFAESSVWGHSLVWRDHQGREFASVDVFLDRREPDHQFLLVEPLTRPSPVETQQIKIVPGQPGRRAYLRCPISGLKKDLLFLREGWFADFKAQRLVHRSQRRS